MSVPHARLARSDGDGDGDGERTTDNGPCNVYSVAWGCDAVLPDMMPCISLVGGPPMPFPEFDPMAAREGEEGVWAC